MREYSELFHQYYNSEEVRFIPNMQQNYKYLASGAAYSELVDIICGSNNRIVFVWRKSEVMDELYSLWCKREL